jgi:TetR/AcrR family transcriptional repressor of nem operon
MARADTKTAILDAAQELIQTRGANGISYQHISEMVRIRKASIHYHFPTKDKLIEAVLRRYRLQFLGVVDAIGASVFPAPAKLRRYTDLFEMTLREGRGLKVCLCGMLGAELATLGRPAVAQVQRFYQDNAERLARILRQGRAAGTLRFVGDPKTAGMVVFSVLEGAMLVSRAHGGIREFRRLRDQVLKLFGA